METSLQDQKRADLWRAAVHEHAHAAVAWHYRVYPIVHIEPNPEGGPTIKHFSGHCAFHTAFPTRRVARLICMAGFIAERLFVDEDRMDEGDLDEVLDALYLEDPQLSATDARGSEGATYENVKHCIKLVKRLWPAIEFEARRVTAMFAAECADACN